MRLAIVAALVAAGSCQTAQGSNRTGEVDQRIAAARGAEVSEVCFIRDLESWRSLGTRAVLLRKGLNDWYQLDLVGACDAEWAYNAVSLSSRVSGSSCLRPGDEIRTYGHVYGDSCAVRRIYEWREENDPAFVPNRSPAFVPRTDG